MSWSRAVAVVTVTCTLWPGGLNSSAQSTTVETLPGVEYAKHDGVALTGDLYLPKAAGKYPALVAVHGGAFQVGSPSLYRHWGPYLAERGDVVFAISYRLVKDGRKMYPEAVQDVRAAV